MEIAKGITPHSVVVVVDKQERSVVISSVLKKLSYNVFVVQSLYGALKVIDQEMPHMIIVDSLLTDGTAGTLYDRLQEHKHVKDTPMLVLVASKTKEQLTPLKGRKFAGFLLGKIDAGMIAKKVTEIMSSHSNVSPYFISAHDQQITDSLTLSVNAKVLGRSGDQVIYLSESEVDESASLVCLPDDSAKSPALLKMGSNVIKGEEIYNLFPMSRIKGKGRKWIGDLPEIQMVGESANSNLRRVLFYDPNPKRFAQFQEVLSGYDMELVHSSSLQMAAAILSREGADMDCIFLDELSNDGSGITFKEALAKLDADKRPIVISGTSSLNARSTAEIRFIHKPFGLGVLVDMIDSACKAKETFGGEFANVEVTYQAQGKLLGIDETGGILQLKFPMVKGSQIHLNHDFLQGIWEGESTVSISKIESLPDKPDIWQAKFVASAADGNKAKYWDQVQKYLSSSFLIEAEDEPA